MHVKFCYLIPLFSGSPGYQSVGGDRQTKHPIYLVFLICFVVSILNVAVI
jgi:hypothetical protein